MTSISKPAALVPSSIGAVLAAWMPILFLGLLFLAGGGSRSDIASLPFLRAAAVLVACWAGLSLGAADWRRIRIPFVLLALLTVWMAVQLVPMPPVVWQGLPGREAIVAIDRLLGQPDVWRPITLTPTQGWNALLGMTVPFAALFVAARIAPDDLPRLLWAIFLIGCVSALLGLVQIMSGPGSSAYLYRITNSGMMVGLFANRNHHAIFVACTIIVAGMLLRDELLRKRRRTPIRIALALSIAALTALTALIGSRAGLVAGVAAFVASYAMVVAALRARSERGRGAPVAATAAWQRLLIYSPPILMILLMATMILLSDRVVAVNRLADQAFVDDIRVQAWPTVQQMMQHFWLLGSGFGSFASTYKMFEPDALLGPAYFNHAHNDWAELLVTGGLPFALILLASLVWIGRRAAARGLRSLVKGHRGDIRLPALLILAIFAGSSLVDYPLRVPSLQAFALVVVLLLCCPWSPRSERD